MSRLLPLRTEELATGNGFRVLVNELAQGLLWVNETGEAQHWNDAAEVLLTSSAGPRIEQLIERLLVACRSTGTCIQSGLELAGGERVRVSVAPDRAPGSFVVVLDRQRLEKARTEASVLRAVLKAISTSTTRHQALQRAMEAVHTAISATHLAFFELDRQGARFECVAAVGVGAHEVVDASALSNSATGATLAATLRFQRPISIADLGKHDGQLPFRKIAGLGALLLPASGRGSQGVVYVATQAPLNEGFLRLAMALADAVGAVLDIAALEQEASRAREIATQRDRLATIGQLVAGVAHEINNPLAFLKSNLHSLRVDLDELRTGKVDPNSEVNQIVTESLEGVSRIETIVQALKGTARKKDEKIRFEPSRAVQEAVTIFRGAHKQYCDIDCTGLLPLPEVTGSPSALGQVTLNLLQNGLDAMAQIDRKLRRLEISSRREGDRLTISFRDHGTGIPYEVQKRMFDAFFTTKEPGKGTGLGLAICKEIVESMEGTLGYTTGPQGTCFDLTLPMERDD